MNLMTLAIYMTLIFTLYNTYLLSKEKKDPASEKKRQKMLKEKLPDFINKSVEISFNEPLACLDLPFQCKAKIIDYDDEWLFISVLTNKKEIQKIIRISLVENIKEIG